MEKILVCDGVTDLKKYLENHKDIKICLYLAEKTKEAWDISTSRVYMNQIDERFVYLPVNIKKGDWESIREVYTIVIIFGVGGVGEPIARIIANKKAKCLYLIDISSKEELAKDLSKSANVIYLDCLSKVDFNINNKIVLINCAGKEGGDDKTIVDVLKQLRNLDNIFVDLRPQLDIEIVNIAKQQGWNAYTGFGMNSRNDYVLLQKIQDITGINIPSFEQFAKLVKDAS